jgi:hypothetical protein
MPEFAELYSNARIFSQKLARAYANQYSCGSLFPSCSPSFMDKELMDYADLVELMADVLNYYPGSTTESKKLVLIGIYVYLWYLYDSSLHWFLNRPLLNLLQENLDIGSLSELDKITYRSSLKELSIFFSWVSENQNFVEIQPIYAAIPAEMQGNLNAQQYAPLPESSTITKALSSLMAIRYPF